MTHKKPWHTKGKAGTIQKVNKDSPGAFISIDQLVSAQPGLIPQIANFLTNSCIWGANVFVNHYFDYVFVNLMQDLPLDKTLLAKTSFERHEADVSTTIRV